MKRAFQLALEARATPFRLFVLGRIHRPPSPIRSASLPASRIQTREKPRRESGTFGYDENLQSIHPSARSSFFGGGGAWFGLKVQTWRKKKRKAPVYFSTACVICVPLDLEVHGAPAKRGESSQQLPEICIEILPPVIRSRGKAPFFFLFFLLFFLKEKGNKRIRGLAMCAQPPTQTSAPACRIPVALLRAVYTWIHRPPRDKGEALWLVDAGRRHASIKRRRSSTAPSCRWWNTQSESPSACLPEGLHHYLICCYLS